MSDDKYFAQKPADEVMTAALDKAETFYNGLYRNNYLDKLRRMYRFYYGMFSDTGDVGNHEVNFAGEDGELVSLHVNHFRNLATHIYTMITTNRPVMEARAVNTDYKSMAQTYLANGILDYYMREKGLEDILKKAVEMSIVLGSSFIKMEWNATAGEVYDADPENGTMQHEGEIEYSVLSPFDVVVDGTKDKWDKEWVMIRTYKNRYNLAAKYPELREKILALPKEPDGYRYMNLALWSNDNTDDIPVYEFFHSRTDAMPNGRYILACAPEVVMIDMDLPYRLVPIFRIAPSDIMGTPYGYTPMFDVFPLQEAIDSIYSTILTNQSAFGVQNLWVPKGADMNMASYPGGLNIVESAVKPEALQLTETPAEIFKFLEVLVTSAETISGVNSVARGNAPPNLESGVSLALVQAMALQFISGLQQSYVKLIESVGTATIQLLKDFATTPKIVALVGKNNRTYLKEFTGEQISAINRVIVDVGNPLSHSIAGRIQMADNLLQYQLIKDPRQYYAVLNTGRLDLLYEGEMGQILNIQRENEKLMDGERINALFTDDHKLHISEHSNVLNDPDLRSNPDLVMKVGEHIQQHMDLLRNTDPEILMLLGQQPLQPIGMPPQEQQQPTQEAINANMSPEVLSAQSGFVQPGETIVGPNQEQERVPGLPQVPASALANPALQQQSLGNVKPQ